jgi:hypothetical protein
MTERGRILELLAEGRINVDEAERLLDAVRREEQIPAPPATPEVDGGTGKVAGGKPRTLRVLVNKADGEQVNIRVPLGLLRAGLKLKGLLPGNAKAQVDVALQEKGINFNLDDLDAKSLESIVEALGETRIEIDSDKEKVQVFCE